MSASDNLSPLQFKFTPAESEHVPSPKEIYYGLPHAHSIETLHRVDALNSEGSRVGRIQWEPRNGRVESIGVEPALRRKGIATTLWHEAHTNAQREGLVHPVHSDVQMPDGQAWAAGLSQNATKDRGRTSRKPKASPGPDQAALF
jgi:GNAT superfamily N-acetyltransferase